MKDCTFCKHAKWHLTSAGRLHLSGFGRCSFPLEMPTLPASMYWTWLGPPKPYGGHISRKEFLKDDCVYFARKEAT